jgi:hypothetical protein
MQTVITIAVYPFLSQSSRGVERCQGISGIQRVPASFPLVRARAYGARELYTFISMISFFTIFVRRTKIVKKEIILINV